MPRPRFSYNTRSKGLLTLASLVSTLSLNLLIPEPPTALAAAGLAFECDGQFYQMRSVASTTPPSDSTTYSKLFRLDRRVNPYTQNPIPASFPNVLLNGMGFNSYLNDNYLYAIYLGPNLGTITGTTATSGSTIGQGLYKIGQSGADNLGPVTNLPTGFKPTAADFDAAGNLYVTKDSGDDKMYKINVGATPPTATVIPLSRAGVTTGNRIPNLGDMSFNHSNNTLYGVDGNQLYIITTSGSVTTQTMSTSGSWGTTFFDAVGEFYIYDNNGGLVHVNLSTGNVTTVSTAPPAAKSDGGVCSFIPPTLDVVKSVGTAIRVNATTFDVPYTVAIKNTGTKAAPNVQINEDLKTTFATGNPTIAILNPSITPNITTGNGLKLNSTFNGDTDNKLLQGSPSTLVPANPSILAVGTTATISFTVRVTYPTTGATPTTIINNRVRASTISTPDNPGFYTPSGSTTLLPPPDVLDIDESTNVSNAATDVPVAGDTPSPTPVTLPTTSNASVLLVKRITKINGATTNPNDGTVLTESEDNTSTIDPSAINDNNANWPNPKTAGISTFLKGKVNGGKVKPGDEIEYTIYYLNPTVVNASNLKICDRLIGKQALLAGSTIDFHQGDGTSTFTTVTNLTTAADTDRATYYPNITPDTTGSAKCNLQASTDTNKAGIAVNIGAVAGSGGPGTANAYGYFRFKTKINP